MPNRRPTRDDRAKSETLSPGHTLKAGDIIAFSGDSPLSVFINLVTWGIPYWSTSHVGIIAEYNGELLLFESTTLDSLPCVIQGKTIKGTQAHRLDDRLATYAGRAWRYPLYRDLFPEESERLTEFLVSSIGRDYDTIGAFRAGDLAGFSLVESLLHEENLRSIFCSEWCCAAHKCIGIFPTDNVSRWSPNHLVRRERWLGLLGRPQRLSTLDSKPHSLKLSLASARG